MLAGDTFPKVLEVLRQTGGYFVFRDDSGEEYVVARRRDVDGKSAAQASERQLPLPSASSLAAVVRQTARRLDKTPEFILDSINREIANYHEEEMERELDDLSVEAAGRDGWAATSAGSRQARGKRVRFEPIHGDLPPDLQD